MSMHEIFVDESTHINSARYTHKVTF